MAVQQGYGKMAGTDALVFAYDTGDAVNSYKGEPTVNILNNNILAYGGLLGEDSSGTFIQLNNDTSGYARFQLPSIPVSSNDIYTWSFELYTTETFTSNYSWDTNEYSDQFPSSNDLSRVTYNHSTPSTIPANTWTPFRLTVTMKDGLTGAYTYDFFRFFFPTFQNKKVYYRNMQFEFKNHKTQYAGQGGTRSATEGLLDLTGNETIDLSRTSFDNNADLDFDGTDDEIQIISSNWAQPGEDITVEAMVYREGYSENSAQYSSIINASNDVTGIYSFSFYVSPTSNRLAGWLHSSTDSNSFDSGYVIELNTWYHVAFTLENGDPHTVKTFVNGVEQSSSTMGQGVRFANITKTTIGAYVDRNQYEWNGKIPIVKIYNRALSAAEVKSNFNNYKTRFNIA